jgi:hypothetical protein
MIADKPIPGWDTLKRPEDSISLAGCATSALPEAICETHSQHMFIVQTKYLVRQCQKAKHHLDHPDHPTSVHPLSSQVLGQAVIIGKDLL